MLEIVESADPPESSQVPISSFLVSLLLHGLLAVVFWSLVLTATKYQTITLTASASPSAGEVTVDLATKAKLTQPLHDVDQLTQADLAIPEESSVAGSMADEAGSQSHKPEPAQIDFFGTHAFGTRFVFVLDISYSMDARQGERFRRACDELLRSVSELERGQSYYVFLFCWQTEEMFYDPSVQYVAVAPGHVQKLRDWIYGVSLGAGTDPRRSLALARRMKPDAVFLLSDGQFNKPGWPQSESGWVDDHDEPFTAGVQEGVELFFRNTIIHTIAFENPFTHAAMQAIAEATGGKCRYIQTETHRPIDSKRFLAALGHIDQTRRDQSRPDKEYRTRLSYARDFIKAGELVYAEYLVRPLRDADATLINNKTLLTQVLAILDAELGKIRLEDFEPAAELPQIRGSLH